MRRAALIAALVALLALCAAAVAHAQITATGTDVAAAGGAETGQTGVDAAPVQDSDDGESSASASEESSAAAPAASDEADGRVTIIENGNHLNALAEKKQYDEATEARMHEERLKRDQEEHQKKMEAFARREKAEQNLKSEEALKAKTKRAEEEGAKEKVREAKAKAEHESTTKKSAEEDAKKLAREKQATLEKEQKAAADGKAEAQKKAVEHAKRKEQLKTHHKDAKGKLEFGGEALSLRSGWANYGHSYKAGRVHKWGRICTIEGLIKGSAGLMAHLPGHCRPYQGRLIFTGHRSAEHRVDVLADGRIYRITGSGGYTWTSISGMVFDTHIERHLNRGWGWHNYGSGYRPTTETYNSGLCVISGLIRSGSWNYFARTSGNCYPGQQLIFSGNNHHHITRVDVRHDGYIFRNGGYHNHHWVSLDGIVYARRPQSTMSLYNGWVHYGHGYRHASYNRIGNLCVLGGLIRASRGWHGHISTLPAGCRPSARLIFGANHHNHDSRVDVLPNGQVHYINRGGSHSWLSLSNIRFVARQ